MPEGTGEAPGVTATPPDTFAVIVFEPHSVDHLVLAKQQTRTRSELVMPVGRSKLEPLVSSARFESDKQF